MANVIGAPFYGPDVFGGGSGGGSGGSAYISQYLMGEPSAAMTQTNEVDPYNGAASTKTPGLSDDLGGVPFTLQTVITAGPVSDLSGTGSDAGNLTFMDGIPALASTSSSVSATSPVIVVNGVSQEQWFDAATTTNTYVERYGGNDNLVDNTTTKIYTLTNADGTVITFGDFNNTDGWLQGKALTETSPGGVQTNYAYDTSGNVTSVTRIAADSTATTTDQFVFSYLTGSDPNAGKISSIALIRQTTGSSAWLQVGSVDYGYYTGTVDGGYLGDLEYVSTLDGGPGTVSLATASGGTLTASTLYNYQVTAVTAGGEGNPSSVASISTTSTNKTITLSWPAVPDALGYNIYRQSGSGAEVEIATLNAGTTYTDTGTTGTTGSPPTVYTGTSYYRYTAVDVNTSDGGSTQDVLEYAYSPVSYAQLLAAVTTGLSSPQSTPDADMAVSADGDYAKYADIYNQYSDSLGQISSQTVQGAGATVETGGGDGLGNFTYSYVVNSSMFSDLDFNTWAFETITTKPDSTHEYDFYSSAGQNLLDVVEDSTTLGTAGSHFLGTYTQYDTYDEPDLVASPSATILLGSPADYTGMSFFAGVAAHTGLVTDTTYSTLTDVPGEVMTGTYVQEGADGPLVPKEKWTYTVCTNTSVAIAFVASDVTFGDAGTSSSGADPRNTSYGYVFYSGTDQPEQITTTLPIIGSTQNGTGATDQTVAVYNMFGQEVWQKDASGYIGYTVFDPGSGAVIESIQDVQTSDTSEFSGLPSGWTTPTGGGLNLITTNVVDVYGRTLESVSAAGREVFYVYNDTYASNSTAGLTGIRNEVRTYTGWTGSTTTGPTEITRDVWPAAGSGNPAFSETLTTNDTPSVTGTTPNGSETVTATGIASLVRDISNSANQVVESDRYFSLASGYNVSSVYLGTSANDSAATGTASYYATFFGYDTDGNQSVVQEPTGTINATNFDSLGDVVSTAVGATSSTSPFWIASAGGGNETTTADYSYDWTPVVPSAPEVTFGSGEMGGYGSGGYDGGASTYVVELTYVYGYTGSTDYAESDASEGTSETPEDFGDQYLIISSPDSGTAPAGVTGYNVYIGVNGSQPVLQNSSPIALGTDDSVEFVAGPTGETPQTTANYDNNLASVTEFPTGSSGSSERTSDYLYDWQDRQVAEKDGVGSSLSAETTTTTGVSEVYRPITYTVLDNADETLATLQFNGDGISLADFESTALNPEPSNANVVPTADPTRLETAVGSNFDDRGQVYLSTQYAVTPGSSSYPTLGTSAGLKTYYFYDPRGYDIETVDPGGLVYQSEFNGAGWDVLDTTSDGGAINDTDSSYLNPADAGTTTYDIVLEQTATEYDDDGNAILVTDLERYDDDPTGASGEGNLAGPDGGDLASRNSSTAYYYDDADRQTYSVNVGTNDSLPYLYQTVGVTGYQNASSTTSFSTSGTVTSLVSSSTFGGAPSGSFVGEMISFYSDPTPAQETVITGYDASSQTFTFSNGSGLAETAGTGIAFYIINPNQITQTTYAPDGQVASTTDPAGLKTADTYNLAGQMTQQIDVDTGGAETSDTNIPTDYTYNGDDEVLTMTAVMPTGTPSQTTAYVYGVNTSSGSELFSNDLLYKTEYPDATTGAASSSNTSDSVYYYDTLGETIGFTDRNQTTHSYIYDVLGRMTYDIITAFGSGVDQTVKALGYSFDPAGRPYQQSSYSSSTTFTSATTINQVQDKYNNLGQLTEQYQEHSGPVTSTSAGVLYGYSDLSGTGLSNTSRLVSMTYPNGRQINYVYNAATGDSAVDTAISRIDGISDNGGSAAGSLVTYLYMGLSTVVQQVDGNGVTTSYIDPGTGDVATGQAMSGGDRYEGINRFGWVDDLDVTSAGTTIERLQYGYDLDGNVLYVDDVTSADSAGNSQLDTYDAAEREETYALGTLASNLSSMTSTSASQNWSLDAVGNWDSVTTDGSETTRSNNADNQIGGLGYDNNGNTLNDGSGQTYTYNAWNQVTTISGISAGSATATESIIYTANGSISTEAYNVSGTVTTMGLYESSSNQLLEQDTVSGTTRTPTDQYVWGLTYVNDLIERDDNSVSGSLGISGSGLGERLYAVQDANHDVIALTTNASTGSVAERFDYTPYGTRTVISASYGSVADSYSWDVGLQGGVQIGTAVGLSTGLVQFDARIYDILLGRWLEQDPEHYIDGANQYQFVHDAPSTATDSLGLAENKKSGSGSKSGGGGSSGGTDFNPLPAAPATPSGPDVRLNLTPTQNQNDSNAKNDNNNNNNNNNNNASNANQGVGAKPGVFYPSGNQAPVQLKVPWHDSNSEWGINNPAFPKGLPPDAVGFKPDADSTAESPKGTVRLKNGSTYHFPGQPPVTPPAEQAPQSPPSLPAAPVIPKLNPLPQVPTAPDPLDTDPDPFIKQMRREMRNEA